MAGKKKWVAFRTNATIPASVIGEDEDKKVNTGDPVHLPADYADHVVHDRFADFCDTPKKPAPKKKAGDKSETELAAAQARVDEAQDALNKAEGTDGADAARADLLAAQEALGALQAQS